MGLKSKPLDKVRADVPVRDVTREELVRINLNVPASVRKAWKIAAVNANQSLSDMIVEAMSNHLQTHLRK